MATQHQRPKQVQERLGGEKSEIDEQRSGYTAPQRRQVSAVLGIPLDQIVNLSEYVLEERLGYGTFSEVFLARDKEGNPVAIKEYRLGIGVSNATEYEQRRAAFQREVRLLESIGDHPQIPDFLGVGAHVMRSGKFEDLQPAIIMEYVDGETIQERLGFGRRFTSAEIRDILTQILDPLEVIHHGNSVPRYHRDIKPANLKLNSEGTLYLLDFGSVRDEIIETLGGTGAIGTPEYKHPDDILGGQPSFRSELYSVGRVLYAAAIGRGLKNRETFSQEKLRKTNLDPDLQEVIGLLCDRDLRRGPQNVRELREYLGRNSIEVVPEKPEQSLDSLITPLEKEQTKQQAKQSRPTVLEEKIMDGAGWVLGQALPPIAIFGVGMYIVLNGLFNGIEDFPSYGEKAVDHLWMKMMWSGVKILFGVGVASTGFEKYISNNNYEYLQSQIIDPFIREYDSSVRSSSSKGFFGKMGIYATRFAVTALATAALLGIPYGGYKVVNHAAWEMSTSDVEDFHGEEVQEKFIEHLKEEGHSLLDTAIKSTDQLWVEHQDCFFNFYKDPVE